MALPERVAKWFLPLAQDSLTLREAMLEMNKIALEQGDIPLIVKLVENPDYDYLPGIDIFSGATDLETHDYIHLLLGRGVLPKDEAFILGFTMGSTNRVGAIEEKLYGLFTRFLYPKHYRFSRQDFDVYKDAVRLGYISDCQALDKVDYGALLDYSLRDAREALGIETNLLQAYYEIEAARYPDSPESQRLVQPTKEV